MKKVKKAIIPAAGYGTRNLPITKVLPKEMFPINGYPAIHYIVQEAVEAGIEELLIVVSRNKNMILDYFDRSLELESFLKKNNKEHLIEKLETPKIHIQYVRQPYAEGLGDAIKLGRSFVGEEPFAVLLPDDLFLCSNIGAIEQLIRAYYVYESSLVGLKKVNSASLKNYGVIKEKKVGKSEYQIIDIVEKPLSLAPSNLAVTGRYVFHPTIFTYLEKIEKGVGGEIQLTDAIKVALCNNEKYYGIDINGERYDIGKEEDYKNLLVNIWEMENDRNFMRDQNDKFNEEVL